MNGIYAHHLRQCPSLPIPLYTWPTDPKHSYSPCLPKLELPQTYDFPPPSRFCLPPPSRLSSIVLYDCLACGEFVKVQH